MTLEYGKSAIGGGRRHRVTLVFAAVIGLLFVIQIFFANVVPKRAMTKISMRQIANSVMNYAKRFDALPTTLASVTRETTDAWGHQISYTMLSEESFRLESYGEDGEPGGSGDDQDVRLNITRARLNGRWIDAEEIDVRFGD